MLLLLSPPARAQVSPVEAAQFWRRLGRPGMNYCYWQGPVDPVRRALASQQADTTRLKAIEYLQYAFGTTAAEDRETLAVATRRRYPERELLRLMVAQALVRQYDQLVLERPQSGPEAKWLRDLSSGRVVKLVRV